jgi:hypothetical protein
MTAQVEFLSGKSFLWDIYEPNYRYLPVHLVSAHVFSIAVGRGQRMRSIGIRILWAGVVAATVVFLTKTK